jgi:DNA segregation ATPase FtsK/SpoIIIE, S-DNA-T family
MARLNSAVIERPPVELTVSDVAQAIVQAARNGGNRAEGGWSTALTGSIFHEVAAGLLEADGAASWQRVLDGDTVGESTRLAQHAYTNLLGPRLALHKLALQSQSAAVLALWTATQELCRLLCDLLSAAQKLGIIRFSADRLAWEGVGSLFLTEAPLVWELQDGGTGVPVRVRGVADVIWRHPENGTWCVLELKTSRRSPEADLAQACLYHRMIAATHPDWGTSGSLAIVRFTPQIETATFTAQELRDAQSKLEALVLRLGRGSHDPPGPAVASQNGAFAVKDEHRELARQVVSTLRHYDCSVALAGDPIVGPSYIRVRLAPGRGAKTKAVQNQSANLHVQLHLAHPPIIHITGGELVVDLQRPDRQTILFADVQDSLPPVDPLLGNSRVMLGLDLAGKVHYVDLADDNNSHILVAGTTGSGKSEWLRVALASLLLTNTPETLRLVLIDPKRTAFGELRNSSFLWRRDSLLLGPDCAADEALDELIEEMERRYVLLEQYRCDKLAALVRAQGHPVPRLVCVCDEFADLLQVDRKQGKAIEQRIVRLGQKARSAGIHLILATQYPNRDVISGALKTQLGGRVCFRTTNHVQSHLMSTPDAEKLLGKGDLIFLDVGQPVRLQAPFLSAEQRTRIFESQGT